MRGRPQSAQYAFRKQVPASEEDQNLSQQQEQPNIPTQQEKRPISCHPKRLLAHQPPTYLQNQFARILPKNIHQDKQRLYSQTLQLKQANHALTNQITKLRTRIAVLQKEKDRKRENDLKMGIRGQSHILQSLKFMNKQAKQKIQRLNEENYKMKKVVKYTKIQQLQVQRSQLAQQALKLKKLLQQQISKNLNQYISAQNFKDLEDQLNQKITQNNSLRDQLIKLQNALHYLQQQLKGQASKYIEHDKKIMRQLAITRRKFNQKDSQIASLRQNLKKADQQRTKLLKQVTELKKHTTKQRITSAHPSRLQTTQQPQPKQIVELQQQIKFLKNQLKKKTQHEQQKHQDTAYNQEFQQQPKPNNISPAKIHDMQGDDFQIYQQQPNTALIHQQKVKHQNLQIDLNGSKKKQGDQKDHQDKKKTKKKNALGQQLKDLSQLLTYRIKNHRFTVDTLIQSINQSLPKQVNILELSEMFSQQPFYISKQQTMQTLLGFIFDSKMLVESMQISTKKLCSKLKKIIGKISQITIQEQQRIFLHIVQYVAANIQELEALLKRNQTAQGLISKSTLQQLLTKQALSKQAIQYIIGQLAIQSDSMNALNYQVIFDRFYQDINRQDEQMQEVPQQYQQSTINAGDSVHRLKKGKRQQIRHSDI